MESCHRPRRRLQPGPPVAFASPLWRPPRLTFGRARAAPAAPLSGLTAAFFGLPDTIVRLATVGFPVNDQDRALAFYTGKLGFER